MREYKEIYKYEYYKRCSQVIERKLKIRAGSLEERTPDGLRRSTPSLHHFGKQPRESAGSKLQDLDILQNLDMQTRGIRTSQRVVNAKWHVGAGTRVSINLNQKHALKTVS